MEKGSFSLERSKIMQETLAWNRKHTMKKGLQKYCENRVIRHLNVSFYIKIMNNLSYITGEDGPKEVLGKWGIIQGRPGKWGIIQGRPGKWDIIQGSPGK